MHSPILVPLDGSALAEQALPCAELLTGSTCQLILLEVWQDEDDEFHSQDRHDDSCARLEAAFGDPGEEILRAAEQLGAGMIVMITHGRGALGRWALGSVADKVARSSSIPVMLIRPVAEGGLGAPPQIRRLVVPLDGSALAEQALPAARVLAQRLQAPVHLLTIVGNSNAVAMDLTLATFDAASFGESSEELFAEAEELVARHAEHLQCDGSAVTWEVLRGSPYFAIAETTHPGDVIVMASRRRHGVERWILGSIAEKLVREGPVPVILVPARQRRGEVAVARGSARPDAALALR